MDEHATALDVAAAIRAMDVSPLEVLDACLKRIDERNPALNAVIWRNDDEARAEAKRLGDRIAVGVDDLPPFAGVPLPIKDLLPVAGQPVTYGSRGAPDGPSSASEPVADAFVNAGFILTGRTNTPEFGSITVTENSRFGATRNPWNTDHTPGGSSGGAGSAGGRRHVCGGPRQRRRRFHQDPGIVLRAGGPQAEPGPGALHRPRVAGHVHRGSAGRHGGRRRRRPRCHQRPRPVRVVECTSSRASVRRPRSAPIRDGCGWPCARCSALGLPVADEPVAAVERAGRLLEAAGHQVSRLDADVFDPSGLEAFLNVINGGLAETEGIDWARVEPHNQAAYASAETCRQPGIDPIDRPSCSGCPGGSSNGSTASSTSWSPRP